MVFEEEIIEAAKFVAENLAKGSSIENEKGQLEGVGYDEETILRIIEKANEMKGKIPLDEKTKTEKLEEVKAKLVEKTVLQKEHEPKKLISIIQGPEKKKSLSNFVDKIKSLIGIKKPKDE